MTQSTLSSCSIPYDILQKYPTQVYARFISNPETEQFSPVIPDTIAGMVEHIEKCGQSYDVMGTEALINEPYSTKLLELDGLQELRQVKSSVLLESLEIYTYDPKLIGSSYQSSAVNSEVTNSISTLNQVLLQSQYMNGMVSQAQPSFVRPKLYIDERAILRGVQSPSQGNNAIGLPTPFCRHFYIEIPEPQKIELFCGAGVWIPEQDKVRRLFVLGVLNFRMQI